MEKYFMHDGRKQIGPFSIAELIEKRITGCTPVYSSEIGHYVTASEIPDLNNAFTSDLLKTNSSLEKTKKGNASLIKRLGWALGILVVLIVSFVIYRNQLGIPDNNDNIAPSAITAVAKKEEQQLRSALQQTESENPGQYLNVHGKMHTNLMGQKIIKGNIINLASAVGYKDLQMEVVFLSASQAELQTQKFFVNGFIKSKDDISFRNLFKAPQETEGFRLKVLSATPVL